MIQCPTCGEKYRPGTLFCSKCGTYLPTGGSPRTVTLPTDRLSDVPYTPPETGGLEQEAPVELRAIRVRVLETEREVTLPPASELLMGRRDPMRGIFPDLDLTADGGIEKGVSRRHARILQKEGKVFLEDVGSANGTFLNDQRLMPYLPYPLRDGDRIRIGKLELEIHFE
ncbi:MAG TPA: FHA domain-containing protein [Chloroflexi bacterium]|nr:FHA domain-containing protein [Chloroflexota bacterium]